MTEARTVSQEIVEEVTSWPGVEVDTEERGELAFKVGPREFGHLHGGAVAHFSLPKDVWVDMLAQGRITPHPVFPNRQGPAARRIENDADVRDVIEMLRLGYDRLVARGAA